MFRDAPSGAIKTRPFARYIIKGEKNMDFAKLLKILTLINLIAEKLSDIFKRKEKQNEKETDDTLSF